LAELHFARCRIRQAKSDGQPVSLAKATSLHFHFIRELTALKRVSGQVAQQSKVNPDPGAAQRNEGGRFGESVCQVSGNPAIGSAEVFGLDPRPAAHLG